MAKDYSLVTVVDKLVRPRSGRLKLAQHFSAGNPVLNESKARLSGRQIQPSVSRTAIVFAILIPAINRRTIFDRPLRGLIHRVDLASNWDADSYALLHRSSRDPFRVRSDSKPSKEIE